MKTTHIYAIGIGLAGVGLLFLIIALATPSWSVVNFNQMETISYGAFALCSPACALYSTTNAEVRAVEAMLLLGVLAAFTAVGLGGFYMVWQALERKPTKLIQQMPRAAGLTLEATSVLLLLAIIIWGGKIQPDIRLAYNVEVKLSYSFGLCILSALLMAVGGAPLIRGDRIMVWPENIPNPFNKVPK